MRKPLAAAVVAALIFSAGAAFATETTGTIKSIDTAKKSLTLKNGVVYMLPATVDVAKLKVGEAVKITFEKKNKVNVASAVVPK